MPIKGTVFPEQIRDALLEMGFKEYAPGMFTWNGYENFLDLTETAPEKMLMVTAQFLLNLGAKTGRAAAQKQFRECLGIE